MVREILKAGPHISQRHCQREHKEGCLGLFLHLKGLGYTEKYRKINFLILSAGRLLRELIQAYKISNKNENLNQTKFTKRAARTSRGHSWKLETPHHWRTTARGEQFYIMVSSSWNSLDKK